MSDDSLIRVLRQDARNYLPYLDDAADEIERLRDKVEKLNDVRWQLEDKISALTGEADHVLITDEQIDAAWGNKTDGGACLEDLGIVECPECGGLGQVWPDFISRNYKTECPRCHGHRWIREERGDE